MKNQKGITLISLTVYIIALILVVATLSAISDSFFSRKNYLLDDSRNIAEYNKFDMYFIEDVKSNKTAQVTANEIIFEDGTVYTYIESDKGIYRNRVKICSNIENCRFYEPEEPVVVHNTTKQIIIVDMRIATQGFLENEYVLKYW